LGADLCESDLRNHVLGGGPDPSREEAFFEGDICWQVVTYLSQADVSAQCTWQMNAFTTTKGDKMVMWPVAKYPI